MAVHGRPAAFEGSDGMSYSVELDVDETGEPSRPYGGYILFLRWRRIGAQGVEGHLETGFLAFAGTPDEARAAVGAMSLGDVRAHLERLIGASRPRERRWWDVMRDDAADE